MPYDKRGEKIRKPLDFATLPPGVLSSYASSPNVCMNVCGTCGASVFWHEDDKPDVIDVSVGLLRAGEGARAEHWLDWWIDRVSCSEEVGSGRAGWAAAAATSLVKELEKGFEAWK
jgi:hypothetical protein